MVLFGILVLLAWWRLRRGDGSLLGVTKLIGLLYVATGIGRFIYRHGDPFQLLFVFEGALLLLSAFILSRTARAAG